MLENLQVTIQASFPRQSVRYQFKRIRHSIRVSNMQPWCSELFVTRLGENSRVFVHHCTEVSRIVQDRTYRCASSAHAGLVKKLLGFKLMSFFVPKVWS